MLQTDNSIRGKVMRELIARVASDNLIGRKFKSGELRKKMTEPEWRVSMKSLKTGRLKWNS